MDCSGKHISNGTPLDISHEHWKTIITRHCRHMSIRLGVCMLAIILTKVNCRTDGSWVLSIGLHFGLIVTWITCSHPRWNSLLIVAYGTLPHGIEICNTHKLVHRNMPKTTQWHYGTILHRNGIGKARNLGNRNVPKTAKSINIPYGAGRH